jgi:hypothetical protein
MTTSIDEERDRLLPRIERDQRDLAGAINDLQTVGAESGRRAVIWLGAVVVPIVAARTGAGARRNRILSGSTAPVMSKGKYRIELDTLLNRFRMPEKRSSMGSAFAASLLILAAGGLFGAGIALLLAPKTGVEIAGISRGA